MSQSADRSVRCGRETEISGMASSLVHATNHVGKLPTSPRLHPSPRLWVTGRGTGWYRGRVEAERVFEVRVALFPLFKYLLAEGLTGNISPSSTLAVINSTVPFRCTFY